MKRLTLVLALAVTACAPDIDNTPPTAVTVAQFDPSAAVPLVPRPNDLVTNPATGFLAITPTPGSTGADTAFFSWLNTLDGYPTSASATATFSGRLDGTSVTPASVRVLDVDTGLAPVSTTVTYSDTASPTSPGLVTVLPPDGGWVQGKSYAVAIIAGSNGVKAQDGTPVVASTTWALVRASSPLVTCTDLAAADCRPATAIIPSNVKGDPARRLADQTRSAISLERLRRKYEPVLTSLINGGVAREDIVLVWTFKVFSGSTFVFNPAASPPSVPTPTNLVLAGGALNIPVDPRTSPAYQEFTTDYLNTLDGYPPTSPATATVAGDIDPASVSPAAFRVISLAGGPLSGAPTFSYSATTRTLTVLPPGGSWGKGRTIAIAALAGVAGGLRGTNGRPLAASDAFALARSASTLVDCSAGSTPCASAVPAAPITGAQATALEQLRLGYKPVFDALEAAGSPRVNVVGLWVFSTVSQPQLTFDLAAAVPVIPFPSNAFLRTADDASPAGRLTFPVPPGPTAALFQGLNTLDGFSTTAPIVSENSPTRAALDTGNLDPASFADGGVGFAKLDGGGPLSPDVRVCLNCTSSDAGAPEQLQWVPSTPLEPLTRYAGWVSTTTRATGGKQVRPSDNFALVRLRNPLLDASNRSTVPVISDAQAVALEPFRLRYKDCLDRIEALGTPRKNIALAYCYTTQSTVSVVQQLAGAVAATPAGVLPDSPTMLIDDTARFNAIFDAALAPRSSLGAKLSGVMVAPWAISATTGALEPNPAAWSARKLPFTIFLPCAGAAPCPAATVPAAGWPVVIFGHGLTGNRLNAIAIANTLAQAGFATVVIDVIYHGDRTTCVGSRAVTMQSSDDAACADPATMRCESSTGRCVGRTAGVACDPLGAGDATCNAAGQGFCQTSGPAAGTCEAGDFARNTSGVPTIAAWNYLDLVNLFATRDNFRYTGSIDFAALVRLLRSTAATSLNNQLAAVAGGARLNADVIHYAGQSLGTFNGNVFAAASPVASRVALNVAGSSQVDVLLTAAGFAAQRNGFLASLAASGITQGSPDFDQFIVLARTILDPADPQNLAYAAVNSSNPARKVFYQTIEGDQVLPTFTADKAIAAASRGPGQPLTFRFTVGSGPGFIPASYPVGARHGFLLIPTGNPDCSPLTASCATSVAQGQVATFLATGVLP